MPFTPADGWTRLTTIDAHTAGEPLRVVTGGYPEIPGDTMLAKRRHARRELDALRRALMLEPRGHADMYGCVVTPAVTEDGDFGVLFMHNEGYSTMCGHGVIAVVTVGIECGLFELRRGHEEIRIDTPAGRVVACATVRGGTVERVSFRNVPSFFVESGQLEIAGLGTVAFDLAFGGAFYAYVDAGEIELRLDPSAYREIVDRGMRIKSAVARAHPVHHPAGAPDLDFLYGTIFVEGAGSRGPLREVCVFADGEVDRSPTGTGVSGLAAILHRRGTLASGTRITVESLIGTAFEVEVVGTTRVGRHDAVVPRVAGRAFLTGRHEFWVDPTDPLREGVLLR